MPEPFTHITHALDADVSLPVTGLTIYKLRQEIVRLRDERDELLTASKTLLGRYSGHDKGDWLPAYHAWGEIVNRLAREASDA